MEVKLDDRSPFQGVSVTVKADGPSIKWVGGTKKERAKHGIRFVDL